MHTLHRARAILTLCARVPQLEGSEWDRTAAEMSVAFARRVAAWGDVRTPQEAQETASTPDATR